MRGAGFALMSFLVVAVIAVAQMPLQAQDAGDAQQRSGERAQRGERGERGGGGGFDREAMMQRLSEMMKERLSATDEEWAVIQPRLTKLQELERQNRGFGRGGFGGFGNRGGGRGGDDAQGNRGGDAQPQRELSPLAQKQQTLRQVLDNENSTPAEIKSALEELRAARKAHEAEVQKAREELVEVLNLRQEAALVGMGLLE